MLSFRACALCLCLLGLAPQNAAAQAVSAPLSARPNAANPADNSSGSALSAYDEKLLRLAEVLGALHYLANLCPQASQAPPASQASVVSQTQPNPDAAKTAAPAGGNMIWRDYMQNITAALHNDMRQNARLNAAFNRSYQALSDNYRSCTTAAGEALARYHLEGLNISAVLLENFASDY